MAESALFEVPRLLVDDLDAAEVLAGVQLGADGQAGAGTGAGDQADDDLVAGQRTDGLRRLRAGRPVAGLA